jgi:hypothetical protein
MRRWSAEAPSIVLVLVLVVVLVLELVGKIPAQNRAVNLSATLLDSCMAWPSNFDHEKLALLERIQPGKEMLVRVVAMLTKLVERFDPCQYRVRESAQTLTEAL